MRSPCDYVSAEEMLRVAEEARFAARAAGVTVSCERPRLWPGGDSVCSVRRTGAGSVECRGEERATPTGLEPATTGSTVQYSNQLSYGALLEDSEVYHRRWGAASGRRSGKKPRFFEAGARNDRYIRYPGPCPVSG